MGNIYHQKLAKILVHYSLKLQPGHLLVIEAPNHTEPLVREVYREAIQAGAHPEVFFSSADLTEILLREGTHEQLQYKSPWSRAIIEESNALLTIWSDLNTRHLSGIDPERQAIRKRVHTPDFKRMSERLGAGLMRWCGTLYPTNAYAQDAGMSLSAYEDFVYRSGKLDLDDPVAAWQKVAAEQERIAKYLEQHDEIHILAPGTDLTYRMGGRKWINCAGTENFPDGEVFTGPIENSVNGHITFSYPAIYSGNEVADVYLTFRDGRVIESNASRGLDYLNTMLDLDEGARSVGEVAFGLNYDIQHFTKDILFDEKIGGTMHMALGASIPESGGVNDSGLHWDMVCDLHKGQVYADGQLCYKEGKFLI
ncbi:MAG TPA: aminopeptidase [Ktedonobacteraceae bacterium]|nr:aminopeptidase [Ktedonobacteraceae bacterium]